jgi:REP element-mobilizing transposase RayT
MKEDPVKLTIEQRHEVERAIREVAERYGWRIHSVAPQSDHTHVVSPRRASGMSSATRSKRFRAAR